MPDSLVGPSVVEIAGVFLERAAQMVLTEDQDVIEALSTQAAQEAFADRIRPGRSVGRAEYLDACGGPCEGRAVLGVVVADEVPRSFAKRSCVAELLGDPGIGGAPGHSKVYDLP